MQVSDSIPTQPLHADSDVTGASWHQNFGVSTFQASGLQLFGMMGYATYPVLSTLRLSSPRGDPLAPWVPQHLQH